MVVQQLVERSISQRNEHSVLAVTETVPHPA